MQFFYSLILPEGLQKRAQCCCWQPRQELIAKHEGLKKVLHGPASVAYINNFGQTRVLQKFKNQGGQLLRYSAFGCPLAPKVTCRNIYTNPLYTHPPHT